MMKTWKYLVLAVALTAVVAIGIVGGRWYGDNRKSNFSGRAELFVYPGMEASYILKAIPDSVVMRRKSLERVMRELQSDQIKPGHYVIEKGKPSVYMPRMLKASTTKIRIRDEAPGPKLIMLLFFISPPPDIAPRADPPASPLR